jgi:TET-Associated Glycosyltransferase
MLIVIPSKGRATLAKQVTLRNWFAMKMPTLPLLCVPAKEKARYENNIAHIQVVSPPADVNGISETRRWILTALAPSLKEKYVLMVDDDMDFCWRPDIKQVALETIKDSIRLQHMLTLLESWLDDGYVHVGLSARQGNNRPFYQNGVQGLFPWRENTRMMNAYAYNVEKLNKLDVELGRIQFMEDFDLTLQLLRKGYSNIVSYEYCWNQRGSNKEGGCSDYRTAAKQKEAAEKLQRFHPDYVRVKVKTTKEAWQGMRERYDVEIQWLKAYMSSQRTE